MDEEGCRASCLLEDTCLAVEYSTKKSRNCKFLNKKQALVENEKTSKIIVFLPRLQRERATLVFNNLKVKVDVQPRQTTKAVNRRQCETRCSEDAFCAAFVFCHRKAGSWCETAMNCLLYSEQQVARAAVEKDETENSLMYFVWKNYDLVKDNGEGQENRRKRRVVEGEEKDV